MCTTDNENVGLSPMLPLQPVFLCVHQFSQTVRQLTMKNTQSDWRFASMIIALAAAIAYFTKGWVYAVAAVAVLVCLNFLFYFLNRKTETETNTETSMGEKEKGDAAH